MSPDPGKPPVTRIVRQAKGVAFQVQDAYADSLKGVPQPHSIRLEDGKYTDLGELPPVPPSIGYQCGQ